jgi:hypothetical protein
LFTAFSLSVWGWIITACWPNGIEEGAPLNFRQMG